MNHFQQGILNDVNILQQQFENLRFKLQHWGEGGPTVNRATTRSRGGARGLAANRSHHGSPAATTTPMRARTRNRSRQRNRATTVGQAGVVNR